jgi:glucokinase
MDKRSLAVDVGGTHVRTAVSDQALRLSGRTDEPTRHDLGPDGVIDQIVRQVRQSVAQSQASWDRVETLVVGVPGPLDSVTGVVLGPPNLPGWDNVPLRLSLEGELQMPVKVVNDANAAALGEFYFGAGRGHRNLVYLTVSTGIGGGVVVEGRLLEGTSGTAGELGHTTIDWRGPMCKCGNRGCLEALASGTAIARRFYEAIEAGERSVVTEWLNGRRATAEDVALGARAGDPSSLAIFTAAGEALGYGIVNCIHTFNPDVIAVGGGVAKAGPLLFDPVQRVVDRYALSVPRRAVRILLAELGEDVGLVGAAALGWAHTHL